jgi:nicotinamidase-related amidase
MMVVNNREVLTTLEEIVNPEYTALLLIDIQNDYCSPGGYLDKMGINVSMLQEVPSRVKPVLEAARRCGVFVVHIMQTRYPKPVAESGAWLRMLYKQRLAYKQILGDAEGLGKTEESVAHLLGGTLEGTWGWQEADKIAPQPGEIIIKKHRSSAFFGTDLDMILRSNGIKTVVSVGVVTHGCVEMTARGAQFLDYYSVLLRDCVATTSREIHEAALLIMCTRLDVLHSSEVIEVWNHISKVK